MKLYFVCQELILMLLFASFVRKMNAEGTFLISPGGGRVHVQSCWTEFHTRVQSQR